MDKLSFDSHVRDCISKGFSVKYLTADEVIDYMKQHNLYRGQCSNNWIRSSSSQELVFLNNCWYLSKSCSFLWAVILAARLLSLPARAERCILCTSFKDKRWGRTLAHSSCVLYLCSFVMKSISFLKQGLVTDAPASWGSRSWLHVIITYNTKTSKCL